MRELSSDERAEVMARVAGIGLLGAVMYHRQATGSSLAEAVAAVRALARERGLLREASPAHEPSAGVLAVGPFRAELLPFLEYGRERYEGVGPGTTIVQWVFDVYADASAVAALAASFGIDPLDFNAHALDASRADLEALRAFDSDELVERFLAFRDAGFRFYFYLDGPEGEAER